ncbi:cell surface antigen I/II-like isoform X2 [Eriocheir sinensis]|uniref:cell surface antigen I/II-like isoform X2 n=1 Tax=Eriocheir sinensis TaxID=95602 RepID=UPI0021C940BD|nr:cell surface antigen I/II-like isoform X2 [Eriocheir sinensis]
MIGLDTRGRGRKALSAAWMWMAVVLAAAGAAAGEANAGTLYPLSSYCTRQNTTLSCIIADDKTYQLDSFKWDGIQKAIIKNALVLMLMDPLCSSMAKREVEVHSSSRVTTVSRGNNCSQQVVIYDSKNVRLIDGVDLVRMINSEADEINLPRVSQFDLRESVVKKVSVRVDGEKSTIENSKIEAVKAMVIEGDFQFIVENSTLVKVEGFKYNSTKEATFKDTLLESVATNGFVVERGTVKIQDSRIGSVEALGMAVEGGTLVIANSVLHSVAINSIVVSKGGSVLFENVTVATESGIFFTISKGTMDLYALGLLWHTGTSHSTVSLVLYMGITMVASLGVGAGIMYYKMTRSGVARTEVDMTQLIQREQPNPPCQPDSMAPKPPDSMPPKPPDSMTPKPPDSMAPKPPDSRSPKIPNNNNNDKNKNTPAPPLRPLPAPPQPPQDDEMYEQYSDVQLPTGLPPHRPPMPIPDESSSTGGSTLPMSGHHLPMPPNLPKWRDPEGAEMNDDRDRLPPPPPPDDIYDDLMTELPPHISTKPLPPIPLNKKAPKPPTPFRKH